MPHSASAETLHFIDPLDSDVHDILRKDSVIPELADEEEDKEDLFELIRHVKVVDE